MERARTAPHGAGVIYQSVLIASDGDSRTIIEMAPIPNGAGAVERGVVAEGPVGSRWLLTLATLTMRRALPAAR